MFSLRSLKPVFIYILVASFCTSNYLGAEIYKWVDKNGKIHFSDKPVDKTAKKIKEKNQLSKKYLTESRKRIKELMKFQKRMETSRNEKEYSENTAKIEKQNETIKLETICKSAKKEVRLLGKGRPTYYENEKGKRVFLSDKEKNESIKFAQNFIKENCN